MKKYDTYVNGIHFFVHEAKSCKDAIEKVKDQIENLNPLNSSESGREAYRNRFRGQPIEAFVQYSEKNPYRN